MTTDLATIEQSPNGAALLEKVVVDGDLGQLTPQQRLSYYRHVCDSVGLNPLTKPFAYIKLNGKLTLYALRDAADQLRKIHGVSVQIIERQMLDGVYVVTARATTGSGRADESTGAVAVANLKGEAMANALMKAETKAKRRVTLSICGLGWLDETEAGDIPSAEVAPASDMHGDDESASHPRISGSDPDPDAIYPKQREQLREKFDSLKQEYSEQMVERICAESNDGKSVADLVESLTSRTTAKDVYEDLVDKLEIAAEQAGREAEAA